MINDYVSNYRKFTRILIKEPEDSLNYWFLFKSNKDEFMETISYLLWFTITYA